MCFRVSALPFNDRLKVWYRFGESLRLEVSETEKVACFVVLLCLFKMMDRCIGLVLTEVGSA